MQTNARILQEILALAKQELLSGADLGYTMPDGRHHIYIYPDKEDRWDDGPSDQFFVIEPNRVVNGGHEPMGDTYLSESQDLSEVLIGCQWCLDLFAEDDRQQEISAGKDQNLPDELTVRLDNEAGWMEAEGKIEIHDWDDLRKAIRDAEAEYYASTEDHIPFCIEDTVAKILTERFPPSPEPKQSIYKEVHILVATQETGYGIECQVFLHPSEIEALEHADDMRKADDFDETRCNFDICSEVIDAAQFADASPNQIFNLLTQPPRESEPSQKLSLDDKIRAAAVQKVPQEPNYSNSGRKTGGIENNSRRPHPYV